MVSCHHGELGHKICIDVDDVPGRCAPSGFAEKSLYVLVVDHIDTFASPTRQMLLYTLFDLHHRSDIRFIVLGLSEK